MGFWGFGVLGFLVLGFWGFELLKVENQNECNSSTKRPFWNIILFNARSGSTWLHKVPNKDPTECSLMTNMSISTWGVYFHFKLCDGILGLLKSCMNPRALARGLCGWGFGVLGFLVLGFWGFELLKVEKPK